MHHHYGFYFDIVECVPMGFAGYVGIVYGSNSTAISYLYSAWREVAAKPKPLALQNPGREFSLLVDVIPLRENFLKIVVHQPCLL